LRDGRDLASPAPAAAPASSGPSATKRTAITAAARDRQKPLPKQSSGLGGHIQIDAAAGDHNRAIFRRSRPATAHTSPPSGSGDEAASRNAGSPPMTTASGIFLILARLISQPSTEHDHHAPPSRPPSVSGRAAGSRNRPATGWWESGSAEKTGAAGNAWHEDFASVILSAAKDLRRVHRQNPSAPLR